MGEKRYFMNIEHLSLRALVLAAIGSGIITAASMYVALKLGMVPWPTVFAAIISMAILKMIGGTSKHEINVAQTGMTAGAMIAAGIGFTLPGLWQTEEITLSSYFLTFVCVSIAGLSMGLLLTWIWKDRLIKKEKLPFPIGIATAEIIESADKESKKTLYLSISLIISALYAVIRDWFGKIPGYISFKFTSQFNMETGILLAPLAPAIGYMIGPLYTLVLLIGGILGYILLVPIGISLGIFSSYEVASSVRETIGLGLMVGAGLGIIIKFVIDLIKKHMKNKGAMQKQENKFNKRKSIINVSICLISFILCIIAGLSPIVSALVLVGVFITTLMSALITGQTGIDPLEIFGILVMITIRFIVPSIDIKSALLIAATVAVTSGFVGDTMFDYKTGDIFGTNPKAQMISQLVGGIVGAVVASVTIFIMIESFGPVFSETLPAPQAGFVYGMINGSFNGLIFWSAASLGALLYILKVPSTTLGIGLYLPFGYSISIFIGGAIRFLVEKFYPKKVDNGTVIASGLFGGESFTGVIIAFISLILA